MEERMYQSSVSLKGSGYGGNQVKTIPIRLPDVEAAMLLEAQKRNKLIKDLQQLVIQQIRQKYQKNL